MIWATFSLLGLMAVGAVSGAAIAPDSSPQAAWAGAAIGLIVWWLA